MYRTPGSASRPIALVGFVLAMIVAASPSTAPAQIIWNYNILPGAEYTYFPSPEGPGIPGCDPSQYECAFGLVGRFSLVIDTNAIPNTAQFTNFDMHLVGNDDVQNNPPIVAPVTSDRVAAWLAARTFNQLPVAAPINLYQDSHFMTLSLSDFLNGTIELTGGYDARPVDGDGLNFHLNARLVPEPASASIAAVALLFCCVGWRKIVRGQAS